jgi:transposase
LEHSLDGEGQRADAERHCAHLARIRTEATSAGELQTLERSVLRREGPRHRRALSQSKVAAWFKRRPRYHLHFTPTSGSWLNQVERWFAKITEQRLRRSAFRSVDDLEKAIRQYLETNNRMRRPELSITHKSSRGGKSRG